MDKQAYMQNHMNKVAEVWKSVQIAFLDEKSRAFLTKEKYSMCTYFCSI